MSALASGGASGAVAPASAGPSYAAPTSVEDVIAAMAAGARVVAGGTDLVVGSRQGKWTVPEHLVSIHRVESLRGIRETVDGGLWLGALATHGDIADERADRRGTTRPLRKPRRSSDRVRRGTSGPSAAT